MLENKKKEGEGESKQQKVTVFDPSQQYYETKDAPESYDDGMKESKTRKHAECSWDHSTYYALIDQWLECHDPKVGYL